MAELAGQAGDLLVADAARDHLVEPGQRGVHVHGQAMGGHAASHPHADGGQLALIDDPDSGQGLDAAGGHAEGGGGLDDGRLQAADVAAQVERVAQLDDGVGDQLARPVEGDVAAAIDAHEFGAKVAQAIGTGQQVRLIAAATDGVDREVLEQQQPVADSAAAPLVGQLVLQLPGRPIGDGPQPLDGQDPAMRGHEGSRVAGGREGEVAPRPAQVSGLVRGWGDADVTHGGHGGSDLARRVRQPPRPGRAPARRRGSWNGPRAPTGRGRSPSPARCAAGS